ncbi:MAG: aldo/keto reductase [Clostridiales bacterium]|nr:aldo/keto reductase [Clostridiales bacterium]
MQYREDKRSGAKLSALGFGCMRFPGALGRIDKEKTEALLLKAFESGINYYDTAFMYSGSEETVGEIFERHGIREKVYIATKLPHAMCNKTSGFDRFFKEQKKRLRTNYIDYYMMHNITDFEQWERLCKLGIEEWIAAKKANGEIKQIGFSFHGPYLEFVKILDNYEWDFTLVQYNYINTNYQAGTMGIQYAAQKGLSVFTMEPLLGGKLANLSQEALDVFQQEQPGSTAAGWALRFVWNEPDVVLLLSGMNEISQLEENLSLVETALPRSLTDPEKQAILTVRSVFKKSYKIPCTGCNYCMPCPQKINIPACFETYNASYQIKRGAATNAYIVTTGALGELPHYASDCTACGKCISQCPQQIEIPAQLKSVRRRLQFPGMKALMPLVSKMMARRT